MDGTEKQKSQMFTNVTERELKSSRRRKWRSKFYTAFPLDSKKQEGGEGL